MSHLCREAAQVRKKSVFFSSMQTCRNRICPTKRTQQELYYIILRLHLLGFSLSQQVFRPHSWLGVVWIRSGSALELWLADAKCLAVADDEAATEECIMPSLRKAIVNVQSWQEVYRCLHYNYCFRAASDWDFDDLTPSSTLFCDTIRMQDHHWC